MATQTVADKDARIKELEALLAGMQLKVDHKAAEAAYKAAVTASGVPRGARTYNGYRSKGTLDGAMLVYAIEFVKAHSLGSGLEVSPHEVARFVDTISRNVNSVQAAMKTFPEYTAAHPTKENELVHAPSYGMWRGLSRMVDFEWGDADGYVVESKYAKKAFDKLGAK